MESLFPHYGVFPRAFFVDMNAFYASVEQQECPAYRGKPLIVVPVLTDHTCAIAASYEAKARGIKTGSSVRLARSCPDLQIVEARPSLYLDYHARLVAVLHAHFASIRVLSVDEMICRIPPPYGVYKHEVDLALRVKKHIYQDLGDCMRCSVGIGPNVFLAKVASDRQKPDGLTLYDDRNLPEALFPLKLTDLPGIGSAMKQRLEQHGILDVEALWNASARDLRRAWGSVVGERWWYMLRGSHECDYQPAQLAGQPKKSVGHSHILSPELRTLEAAKKILLELFAKALKRLRAYQQAASAMQITVRFRKERGSAGVGGVWQRNSRRHLHANDELTWLHIARPILDTIPDLSPSAKPLQVGIVFSGLLACRDTNLGLFADEDQKKQRLALAVDAVNRKPGGGLYLASAGKGDQVPARIPFGAPEIEPAASDADLQILRKQPSAADS